MKKLCVGIDVAKNKFDVAFTVDGENYFGHSSFKNSIQGFEELLSLSNKYKKEFKTKTIHLCMEATGIYHCELCEYLHKYSALAVSVVNPFQSKSFSKSLLLRTKNDKVDSEMLARLCFERKLKQTKSVPLNIKELRCLVRLHNAEVKKKTEERNRLYTEMSEISRDIIRENILFIDKQLKSIEDKITQIINNDDKLKNDLKLLLTVPCIGKKSAWIILSEYIYESPDEIRPKSCVAHAGLSPKAYDSADKQYHKPHISKEGVARIRSILYMAALTCVANENYFTSFYNHLVEKGKAKKIALTAVSRKVLLNAMGVLKNQKPFDKNWAIKTNEDYLKNLKVA